MRPLTWLRWFVQIAGLVLLGELLFVGLLRCPYIIPFVGCATCPLMHCPGRCLQSYLAWGLGISWVVSGRAFCGWLCPFGFLQDLLAKLPRRNCSRKGLLKELDTPLKPLKYASLGLALFFIIAGLPMATVPIRTGSNFSLQSVRLTLMFARAGYKARLVLVALSLVGGLVVTRAWCRYLCPLGALLGLGNKISLLALRRDRAKCVDCGKYPDACPLHSEPGSVDCTVCAECMSGCPEKAVCLGPRWRKRDCV